MKKEIAEKILKETEAGYDLIAEKFSETRKHFWTELSFLKDYAKEGDKVLDFGCGNGRLIDLLGAERIEYFGVDVSQKLVEIASGRYEPKGAKFQKITSLASLSFPDNYFNIIYSVAVFHHLPSRELREEVTRELYRVLKPGGIIVLTTWNLWQRKYILKVIANWMGKIIGKSELDWNDCNISFKNNRGNVFQRYHHAFLPGELKRLLRKAGFEIKKCQLVSSKNWLIVGQKKLPSGEDVVE